MRGGLPILENARYAAGVFFFSYLLQGCALVLPQTAQLQETWPAALAESAELTQVPFFAQEEFQCGPAALAMTLAFAGADVTPEELVPRVYLPDRHGSLQVEMLAAPRTYGIATYRIAPRFEDVLREVSAGNPVIVLQDFGVWPFPIWHYAVVVGFDRTRREVLLRSRNKPRLAMPFAVLEYTWKPGEHWAMVAVPAGRIPATVTEAQAVEAIAAMSRVSNPGAASNGYRAILDRWPDSLRASIGLGNALYAQGDLPRAEAALRRAAQRHPDSPVVMNNLAHALSDEGRNEEALALIDKAGANPGSFAAAIAETRELILRRMGK